MNALNIKSWADARAFLYVLAPAIVGLLVSYDYFDGSTGALVVALVLAILSPALAVINTQSGFRQWFYGILGAAQALVVGIGLVTDYQLAPWITLVGLVVGGVAAANVDTTPAKELA